jgi:hypothetical protein
VSPAMIDRLAERRFRAQFVAATSSATHR